MKQLIIVVSVLLFSIVRADYWSMRDEFIKNEDSMAVGSKIKLTPKEEVVNKVLMQAKQLELNEAFKHPEKFAPARHFFEAKKDIDNSEVFKIISRMPKGGALHIHDTALSSIDYVVQNISYREHLYACIKDEDISFVFADPPVEDDCYVSFKKLREQAEDVKEFDASLKRTLSLVTENPYEKYPDVNSVWKAFGKLFHRQDSMITYAPAFLDYIYNALVELYKDNVNYVEIRTTLPLLYELNGYPYVPNQVIGMLNDVVQKFLTDYPDFLGVKVIYAPVRAVDDDTMYIYLELFKMMKEMYPDFLAGFDLVGQEDLGQPLIDFVERLSEEIDDIKYYFHAGETNWNGMSTDMNLIDAILLNTTRIGHGYGLLKHPAVLKQVKERDIAIEINPISNQVLNLVKDLRNHPAGFLLAEGYPVVISSDDPEFWEAKPLSHDFYEAFMGIASAHADLRMLKQLALNSLNYSSLNANEKAAALTKFNSLWDKFIDDMYYEQKMLKYH